MKSQRACPAGVLLAAGALDVSTYRVRAFALREDLGILTSRPVHRWISALDDGQGTAQGLVSRIHGKIVRADGESAVHWSADKAGFVICEVKGSLTDGRPAGLACGWVIQSENAFGVATLARDLPGVLRLLPGIDMADFGRKDFSATISIDVPDEGITPTPGGAKFWELISFEHAGAAGLARHVVFGGGIGTVETPHLQDVAAVIAGVMEWLPEGVRLGGRDGLLGIGVAAPDAAADSGARKAICTSLALAWRDQKDSPAPSVWKDNGWPLLHLMNGLDLERLERQFASLDEVRTGLSDAGQLAILLKTRNILQGFERRHLARSAPAALAREGEDDDVGAILLRVLNYWGRGLIPSEAPDNLLAGLAELLRDIHLGTKFRGRTADHAAVPVHQDHGDDNPFIPHGAILQPDKRQELLSAIRRGFRPTDEIDLIPGLRSSQAVIEVLAELPEGDQADKRQSDPGILERLDELARKVETLDTAIRDHGDRLRELTRIREAGSFSFNQGRFESPAALEKLVRKELGDVVASQVREAFTAEFRRLEELTKSVMTPTDSDLRKELADLRADSVRARELADMHNAVISKLCNQVHAMGMELRESRASSAKAPGASARTENSGAETTSPVQRPQPGTAKTADHKPSQAGPAEKNKAASSTGAVPGARFSDSKRDDYRPLRRTGAFFWTVVAWVLGGMIIVLAAMTAAGFYADGKKKSAAVTRSTVTPPQQRPSGESGTYKTGTLSDLLMPRTPCSLMKWPPLPDGTCGRKNNQSCPTTPDAAALFQTCLLEICRPPNPASFVDSAIGPMTLTTMMECLNSRPKIRSMLGVDESRLPTALDREQSRRASMSLRNCVQGTWGDSVIPKAPAYTISMDAFAFCVRTALRHGINDPWATVD